MAENKSNELHDIVIVGAGIAGFAAGVYAARFNLKTVVIGDSIGGTLILTDIVENYPGFELISGMDLMKRVQKHSEKFGTKTLNGRVTDVIQNKDKSTFTLTVDGKKSIESKTVIFATGSKWRKLNVPGEDAYASKGVHYCGLCDGALYKDKRIAVAGAGDSAAKEALLLTQFGREVFIIVRGDDIHPEPINYKRIQSNPKIKIINQANVVEIKGEKFMNKVVLDREFNGSKELALDALFVEIGHITLTELPKKLGVNLNKKGEIIMNRESTTNVPGVFAAGDCGDHIFKQAITGVAEGVTAAFSAYQFIEHNKEKWKKGK
ncbi:MAG TPA: FAD-dependent oxidoreductase [archaeon]|nr:FAD-dependent oxidoreductase [archaeon]